MDNFFKFQVYKVGVIHTDTDDISYQDEKLSGMYTLLVFMGI